jgi:hypothetical protein
MLNFETAVAEFQAAKSIVKQSGDCNDESAFDALVARQDGLLLKVGMAEARSIEEVAGKMTLLLGFMEEVRAEEMELAFVRSCVRDLERLPLIACSEV